MIGFRRASASGTVFLTSRWEAVLAWDMKIIVNGEAFDARARRKAGGITPLRWHRPRRRRGANGSVRVETAVVGEGSHATANHWSVKRMRVLSNLHSWVLL